jgi:competence protein ComEC
VSFARILSFFLIAMLMSVSANAGALRPASYTLEGIVQQVEPHQQRWRLLVKPTALTPTFPRRGETLPALRLVRVTMSGQKTPPSLGSIIRADARLAPPMPPIMPGAFDYQEYLWREGIDATGFLFGSPRLIGLHPPENQWVALRQGLEVYRQRLARHLAQSHAEGAILAAFVTGERGYLRWETEEAWRRSGLTHLLSISGTHIGLVLGFVFWLTRGGLALTPLALRYPVKKWAAVLGWVVAGAYTLLAGASIPTLRSYLMASVVLLGILLERRAISLWTLHLAAVVLLASNPAALKTPGFQLSFWAVGTLIMFYRWQEKLAWRQALHARGWPGRVAWYGLSLLASSVLVTITTAPLTLYHFQTVPLYGAIANLVAIPLTGLLMMPALLLALCTTGTPLHTFFLMLAGEGAHGLQQLAAALAYAPMAVWRAPMIPVQTVFLLLSAFLLVGFLRSYHKGLALLPMGAALLLAQRHPLPDVVISHDGKQVGIFENGTLWVSGNADTFLATAWATRYGLEEATPFPAAACDTAGCVLRTTSGKVLAISDNNDALQEDCQRATLIITNLSFENSNNTFCRAQLLDKALRKGKGSVAIYLKNGTIVSDADTRGGKAWVALP